MRVFVTGATGNIGSRTVKELIAAGHQVIGLCRSDDKAAALAATGAEVYRGSIADPDSLKDGAARSDDSITASPYGPATSAARILRHPGKVILAASRRPHKVVFAFAASEPGAKFRCKLDRKPFAPCHSPRAFLVRAGRHAVRVFAIDAAGNRDRSPALFRFRVRLR